MEKPNSVGRIISVKSAMSGSLYQPSGLPPHAVIMEFIIPVSLGLNTSLVISDPITADTSVGQNSNVKNILRPRAILKIKNANISPKRLFATVITTVQINVFKNALPNVASPNSRI